MTDLSVRLGIAEERLLYGVLGASTVKVGRELLLCDVDWFHDLPLCVVNLNLLDCGCFPVHFVLCLPYVYVLCRERTEHSMVQPYLRTYINDTVTLPA